MDRLNTALLTYRNHYERAYHTFAGDLKGPYRIVSVEGFPSVQKVNSLWERLLEFLTSFLTRSGGDQLAPLREELHNLGALAAGVGSELQIATEKYRAAAKGGKVDIEALSIIIHTLKSIKESEPLLCRVQSQLDAIQASKLLNIRGLKNPLDPIIAIWSSARQLAREEVSLRNGIIYDPKVPQPPLNFERLAAGLLIEASMHESRMVETHGMRSMAAVQVDKWKAELEPFQQLARGVGLLGAEAVKERFDHHLGQAAQYQTLTAGVREIREIAHLAGEVSNTPFAAMLAATKGTDLAIRKGFLAAGQGLDSAWIEGKLAAESAQKAFSSVENAVSSPVSQLTQDIQLLNEESLSMVKGLSSTLGGNDAIHAHLKASLNEEDFLLLGLALSLSQEAQSNESAEETVELARELGFTDLTSAQGTFLQNEEFRSRLETTLNHVQELKALAVKDSAAMKKHNAALRAALQKRLGEEQEALRVLKARSDYNPRLVILRMQEEKHTNAIARLTKQLEVADSSDGCDLEAVEKAENYLEGLILTMKEAAVLHKRIGDKIAARGELIEQLNIWRADAKKTADGFVAVAATKEHFLQVERGWQTALGLGPDWLPIHPGD